jgi:hypothetical protein
MPKEESLTNVKRLNFRALLTSRRTEYKSPCLTVPLLFSYIRCLRNMLTELLLSNALRSRSTVRLSGIVSQYCVLLIDLFCPVLSVSVHGRNVSCNHILYTGVCMKFCSAILLSCIKLYFTGLCSTTF